MTTITEQHFDDPAAQGDLFDVETIRWVLAKEHVPGLLKAIANAAEIFIDLETTGLDMHAVLNGASNGGYPARIVLAALTIVEKGREARNEQPTYVIPLSHPHSPFSGRWRRLMLIIATALQRWGGPLSNQNLKFDLRWIAAHTGIDLSSQTAWDTQLGSGLLDENAPTKLKVRAPALFGVDRWDDFDLTTPGAAERVPLFDLGIYGARDTYWTWRLARLQRYLMYTGPEAEFCDEPEFAEEVEQARLGQLAAWVSMPSQAALTRAEITGMMLDREWAEAKIAENAEGARPLYEAMVDRYDLPDDVASRTPSFHATSLWFKAWADAAVDAGDLRIVSMTRGGVPQWDKHALGKNARAGSDVAQTLLDYRAFTKQIEFCQSWLDKVTPRDTIHATFNIGGAATGRLSSADPNLQQVTKSLKPAFVARPGHVLAEIDYSQLELRIAAFISRCEPMIQAYRDNLDLHVLLAAEVAGVDAADVTADQRQRGKAGNFGFLFGMQAQGFMSYAENNYGVVVTGDEAVAIRQAFFDRWDGLLDWHIRTVLKASRSGQVVSPIGRVRRVPNVRAGDDHAERQCINSPVQGFGSDLMQMAIASMSGYLPGYTAVPGIRVLATVHDSVVVEVPADSWETSTRRCMDRMVNLHSILSNMGCTLDVPLAVEATVGTRWGLADVGKIAS